MTTDWHILGSGAMGCLWAAALQQAGHRVHLVLRNAGQLARYPGHILVDNPADRVFCAQESPASGLQTDAQALEPQTLEMPAWEPEHGPPGGQRPVQWLMIATKAQDASRALAGIARWLSPDATLILLQNGLRVQQQLTAEYGDRVLCLSSSHGAWLRAPWHVVRAGTGEAWLGQLNGGNRASPRVREVMKRLPVEQARLRHDARIGLRLWRKFAVNCAVNALTVVHDCRNGELLDDGPRQRQLRALCEEISTLLADLSQRDPRMPDAASLLIPDLYAQVETVLRATAHNLSSTLQDVRRGRSTELPHLNGYLISLAESAGLPAPRNIALMADIEHCARIPAHL